MHCTPINGLSKKELRQIVGNNSSESNIRRIAQRSLDTGHLMGASFITPTDLVFAVGKVEKIDEKSFVLREETGEVEITFEQVIKGYPVPD